jgi:hypothetical protein
MGTGVFDSRGVSFVDAEEKVDSSLNMVSRYPARYLGISYDILLCTIYMFLLSFFGFPMARWQGTFVFSQRP